MDAIVAVLTALAAVAGIVQVIVTLLERSERKRLERSDHPNSRYGMSSPTWRPPLKSESLVDQGLVDPTKDAPRPLRRPQSKTHEKDYRHQPLTEDLPPFDSHNFAANSRSSLAHFFGFIGAILYWRNPSEKVRFHAAQSLWVDISAVVYFIVSMILIAVYITIRYPEPDPQIAPDDPVMWAWVLTALVGPPVIHVILAILTMTGRNPRIPLVWKIAATIATRQKGRSAHQEGRLASDEKPHPVNSSRGHKLPSSSNQSTVADDRGAKEREHHAPSYTFRQTNENNYEHTGQPKHADQSGIQSLRHPANPHQHTEEIVQSVGRDPEWNLFRTGRGDDKNSPVVFTSYKWLYGVLAILVLIFSLLLIVGIFASTSLGGRITYGILAAFLILVSIGFANMAKSPIRLEIGPRGIELFARSGATWLPWEVVESVTIKRIGGTLNLVAWLPCSDVFPEFDTWGGGPRFISKINAIAVCSLSVLRAPRHQVVRALRTYAGSKFIGISS